MRDYTSIHIRVYKPMYTNRDQLLRQVLVYEHA